MVLKGFFGTLIGITLGGEDIRQVGNIGSFPSGLKKATQVGIGLSVFSNVYKQSKEVFKFK